MKNPLLLCLLDGVIDMLKDSLVYQKINSLLKNTFENSGIINLLIFELDGKEVKMNVRRGVKTRRCNFTQTCYRSFAKDN